MRTLMPFMPRWSNCSTHRCTVSPSRSAARSCLPHLTKPSTPASAAACRARELCPQLIFVGGHFGDYQRLGDAAVKVLNNFTPLVERISIDEAFGDVAGCTHLFGRRNCERDSAAGAYRAWPSNLGRCYAHQAPGENCIASGQARWPTDVKARTIYRPLL
jgi:hypothetical protein